MQRSLQHSPPWKPLSVTPKNLVPQCWQVEGGPKKHDGLMLGQAVLPRAILLLIFDREDEVIPVNADETFAPLLSHRERLILRHLAEGQANKVIANEV